MATYLYVVLTGAIWIFATFIFAVTTAITSGLLTLIIWAACWGIEQLVDLRVGDDHLSDSVKAWTRVFVVCCVLFAPLGFMAANKIVSDDSAARERVSDGTEIRQYILVDYRPPKHVYVTLKDTKTNQVYTDMYVSKHCTFGVKPGDQMNIQVEIWHYKNDPDNKYLTFNNLPSVVCS